MKTGVGRTRTAAARPPDGWWMEHPRYRSYVLFAGTGLVLALVAVELLWGVAALARGSEAWATYQRVLGSMPVWIVNSLLLFGTLFFSLRWLRVGAKIPVVKLGHIPAPPLPVVIVAHYAGLVTVSALLLILLSGLVI